MVGTDSGPVMADGLDEVLGEALGDVLGEVVATWLFDDPPRLARKMPPPTPSSKSTRITAAAGTSHPGRSEGWSWAGRRGAEGLRAGVGAGAEIGARGADCTGAGASAGAT